MGQALQMGRERVAEAVDAGASLDDVEELVAGTGLPAEQEDALWLFAWGRLDGVGQRPGLAASVPLLRS